MTLKESIKGYRKDAIYEQYTRIIYDFKEYEKISANKMMDVISNLYSDYNNIIDICTTRELKYLKMLLSLDLEKEALKEQPKYLESKYDWERGTLKDKFLIIYDLSKKVLISEELETSIKEAIKNVDWTFKKEIDELNEILVGYCKIQGTSLIEPLIQVGSALTGINEGYIKYHIYSNRNFYYYVGIISRRYPKLGKVNLAYYQAYYDLIEDIDIQREKQGVAGSLNVNPNTFKSYFYNSFDLNNPIIKKLITQIKELPYFSSFILDKIRYYSLLNLDRDLLKKEINNFQLLQSYGLSNIIKILDKAMDEMPSAVLNGFTPNEAKKIKNEEAIIKKQQEQYTPQKNAHLSPKDTDLFYKIYFALLDFTNKKYKINPKLVIDPKKGVDPHELMDVLNKFWDNKEKLVKEFCESNPRKFNKEELKITNEFQNGFRNTFIIAKYETEHTALLYEGKAYMIKGLNCNIDEIIPHTELPYITETTIIPFKGTLIYDGLLSSYDVKFGNEFSKIIERDYAEAIKYYHL